MTSWTVKVEKLKNANVSSMMTLSEENRRMQEMMKMYGMYGMDPSMFGQRRHTGAQCQQQAGTVLFQNHKEGEHVQYDL